MESELTKSQLGLQLSTISATHSQKAWHIFALLLSIGRPARPIELSSKCTLFCATPSLLEFLCGIPNSPIYLTPNDIVTLSSVGYIAVSQFVSNSNFRLNFLPRVRFEFELGLGTLRQKKMNEEAVKTYFRKRKMRSDDEYLPGAKKRGILVNFEGEENEAPLLALPCTSRNPSGKAYLSDRNMSRGIILQTHDPQPVAANFLQQEKAMVRASLFSNSGYGHFGYGKASVVEVDQQINAHQTETLTVISAHETILEDLKTTERREEEPSLNSCYSSRLISNQPIDVVERNEICKGKPLENLAEARNKKISSTEKQKCKPPKTQATSTVNTVSLDKNQPAQFSMKLNVKQKNASHRLQSMRKTLAIGTTDRPPIKEQLLKRDKKSILSNQKLQQKYHQVMHAKEKRENGNKNGESSSVAAFDQPEQRVLPDFDGFVAEEQEGSGGYGTVYKARRNSDGVTFAIKCPHANANRNHVHNELKMLGRFGGKNFVIRYEGSFKNGNSDCLVLEHVEHDRPEVLKRDINISELQWYGYCMFRALAGLHKQGVVHRDVKPGNFLFNRKAYKGYLIDFNLAMDLNKKHGAASDKPKVEHDVSFNHVPLSDGLLSSSKNRKFVTAKALEMSNQEKGKASTFILPSKNMKKETEQSKTRNDAGSRKVTKSQGADGSGITSAKDVTSAKTPSGEKFREPLPCQGRKELISLVHEALQTANQKAVSAPVSKRKRIAAPPRQAECKFIYLTPMPLHSAGVAVGGAGLLKNKGDGKHNRDGPCVGTKGFRAPEVLVRSLHQGPKVDVWSAGVTLLYLMIGRTPFTGDPDQNIKEIAKLRGSEDLWEVAKLHNRESCFPSELLDIKSLPSLKLRDWCKHNTRRPEFFDLIPRSLFDLVDKCLTVNPRLRISAEEALKHEFFTSCHEALRKHRLLRQGVGVSPNLILHGQSQTCEEVS